MSPANPLIINQAELGVFEAASLNTLYYRRYRGVS